MRITILRSALSIAALALLAACGGGGGSSTGHLSLNITDAPVDDAKSVLVQFSGVALKPADGPEVVIDFDQPRTIDLLALQGGASATLLESVELVAGRYEWMRLMVQAQRGTLDSYVTLADDSQRSLFVPSGAETGLKLVRGFTVPANGSASFTIDFDLRKSLVDPGNPAGDIFLKPALRVVDNAQAGAIAGSVGTAALGSCANKDPSQNSNVVYVFAGSGVSPDDIDGQGVEPVSTALAKPGTGGTYSYRAAFLSPGSYTVAFTCQGADDAPDSSQAIVFTGTRTVTVVADGTATADF